MNTGDKQRNLSEADKKKVACDQDWKCNKCDKKLPSTYEIDHIVPFSITFDDEVENLQALCPNCHRKKTQNENERILKFKKISSIKECKLCWFCLERDDSFHECSKILRPIVLKEKKEFDIDNLYKYAYSEKNKNNKLQIRLTPDAIWVNNYFTDTAEYTIKNISRAVFIATQRYPDIKYNEVEVIIDFNEKVPDELIEHLAESLPEKIDKKDIFSTEEVEYTFVCIDI